MRFNESVEKVLEQYHQRMEEESVLWNKLPTSEMMKREDEWLLAVGYEVGIFLNTLIKSAESKTILELGTSYGYSTIFLAEAARATGGKVISLEIQPDKADYTQKKLLQAGLTEVVEIRVGDALESLQKSSETFDFVLLDIWKRFYVPCFELFYPKLAPGAWVIADNMIHPPEFLPEANAYRKRVRETNAFDSVLLPLGHGIETSYHR